MSKKKEVYCPLDRVPLEVDVPEKGEVRVARNIYVSQRGWRIWHYHNKEWHEKLYKNRTAVLVDYPQFT